MSKLLVKIDYLVAGSIIKGLRAWLAKLEKMLDAAVLEEKNKIPCRRYNGTDRRKS